MQLHRTLHPLEPTVTRIPGWLFNHIASSYEPRANSPFQFICSYQGETDYEMRGVEGRFSFRWAMSPWKYSHEEKPLWNYDDETTFHQQHNGCWGILRHGNEPATAEQLEAFRKHHYPSAVTGYFDHHTNGWVECEPTEKPLSKLSWDACYKMVNTATGYDFPRIKPITTLLDLLHADTAIRT